MTTPTTALSIAAFAAGVTLMLLAHVLVILWALRRGAGADADQESGVVEEDGGGKGLSAAELEPLPCHDFSSNGVDTAECAVCLEAYEAGDRCRRLPRCEHSFHAKCVDPWLKKSRFCPVCRADVVPREELVKVAGEAALAMEMAAERRSSAALEVVVVARRQQYSWTVHTGMVLR
jgi:cbb3-type cytochrome oxidase subunit 3